ncbi:cation:proton antiporter [Bilifractor sp. LCP19S3_H10]|uniref:cation:proton antiporter n=1 Tax=Bilifractor sp. LCP19S3_H10 TaxID=3438736 RepID=UPI003F9277FA
MDTLSILKDIAIIIIAAKFLGLIARKLKAPQVAGEIIAGLLIGPSVFNIVQTNDFLTGMAEIGVILLMFNAGLETDLDQLKKSGIKATLIACAGVAVPMALGTLLFMCFYGFSAPGTENFTRGLFIGTILAATSVSITVQALRELGKLSTEVGTTIMSAAIIDDVIGILVLTAVISLKNPKANIGLVALKTLLFFVFALIAGYLVYQLMKKIDSRYPHTRRIPIIGLALAFALSYVADKYFGVADITGAYCAGVILCSLNDAEYIGRKMDINSYMIFGPVFFASIGLQTNLRQLDTTILLFSAAFVVVGLVGKIIGCGAIARVCGFSGPDSLKIGVGMMTRGEVALIVAQRGLKAGMMDSRYFTSVILLIIISSIITPIALKALYAKSEKPETPQPEKAA